MKMLKAAGKDPVLIFVVVNYIQLIFKMIKLF